VDFLIIQVSQQLLSRKEHFKDMNIKDTTVALPHIGVAYLLSVAKRHGIKAKYLDMAAERLSIDDVVEYAKREQPRVIGFTGWTSQIHNSVKLAELIKEVSPNSLFCTGGPHGTAMPNETLLEFPIFDFIICGEAEDAIPELFNSNLNYNTVSNIISKTKNTITPKMVDMDSLPFPAWEEFDLSNYRGFSSGMGIESEQILELPVSTSRGCFGACTFCWRQFGVHRRHRKVDSVIEELERNISEFNCKSINFFDETFVDNDEFDWSVELFEKMIQRGINKKIKWAGEMRVDVKDTSIFKLMKESGCYFMFFGVESGDPVVRKRAGKCFSNEQIFNTIITAHNTGINCAAAFILGLPGETEETIQCSMNMAKDLNIYSTTFPIAVPFPGTAVRKMAQKNMYGLKILTNDWSLYDKQYPGVMDSNSVSIDRLRQCQKNVYNLIPQKKMRHV